jgi:hypothetical protein
VTFPADMNTAATPGSNFGMTAVQTTEASYPAASNPTPLARLDVGLASLADSVPVTLAEREARWGRDDVAGYRFEPGGIMLGPHYVARVTVAGRTFGISVRTEAEARRLSRTVRRLLIVGGGTLLATGLLALAVKRSRVRPLTTADLHRDRHTAFVAAANALGGARKPTSWRGPRRRGR